MANTISWGKIYCSSWWGAESNKLSVLEWPEECSLIEGICGTQYTFAGYEGFPERYNITLGGSGSVTLNYNAFGIPDKWVVIQNGSIIADTGYRGDSYHQAGLDNALADKGLPPETIQGGPAGSITFSVTDDPLYIYVYAPMGGTSYNFTVSCPV
jgi:hypothetical protein